MNKKSEVCRVCLDSEQNDCVHLAEKYQEFVLYEFINNITNLNIRLSDGFPDKICKLCYSLLKTAIDFKEKCEASDVILRSQTVKVELTPVEVKQTAVKKENARSAIKTEYEDEYNSDIDCDWPLYLEPEQLKEEVDHEQVSDCPNQLPEVSFRKSECIPDLGRPSRAIDLKLICDDCGGSFKSKCKLKVHWKKTHMLSSLMCPLCKRTFKSYRAFHVHKKKKSKACAIASDKNVSIEGIGRARVFCCNICKYKSHRPKDLYSHMVIHTGDRPYQCQICMKTYTQQASLQGHQETSHGIYVIEITCHICGKYVKGRRKILRHIGSHKKIECSICQKKVTKLAYPNHLRRHTGVKSFTCEICASTFYTTAELCNHKRFKHSKKEFQCDQCAFKTPKEHVLRSHKSKHRGDSVPCIICGRFFPAVENMLKHQRVHAIEKKYSCPHCDSTFVKKDSIKRHLKNKHPELVEKETKLVVKTETNGLAQTEIPS